MSAGAVALALVPRRDAPVSVARVDRGPELARAPSPLELSLVDRLFPPPDVVGFPADVVSTAHDSAPLIAWLVDAEAELARAADPGLAGFARWVGEGLARPTGLRARWAGGPLEGDELAAGWQRAAERALWPLRLALWVRSVWIAGDRAAPLEVAVCDGYGRLAARAALAVTGREVVAGWTRFDVGPERSLLYAPRRNRAVRVWILAGDAGHAGAAGQLGLEAGTGGGGACDLWDARNRERRGVIDVRWRWMEAE